MENYNPDLDGVSARRRRFDRLLIGAIEKLVALATAHWLALVNLSISFFIFLSGLAPLLMSIGLSLPARALYLFFKLFCHDIPDRHYSIFGNPMTLDHRSLAMYAAVLAMGLIFAFVRGRLKPLNWRIFVLLSLPMAVDGFTQLFGLRESTWMLRTITGALFGAGVAWLSLPYIELGMRDARGQMQTTRDWHISSAGALVYRESPPRHDQPNDRK